MCFIFFVYAAESELLRGKAMIIILSRLFTITIMKYLKNFSSVYENEVSTTLSQSCNKFSSYFLCMNGLHNASGAKG